MVIVDYFFRFTRVILLNENSESFELITKLFKNFQIAKALSIFKIHSDHCREFENINISLLFENRVSIINFQSLSLLNKIK